MRFPNAAIVERLRNQYPAGTRVELLEMDDMQAHQSEPKVRFLVSMTPAA
jgi:hypothetical protein